MPKSERLERYRYLQQGLKNFDIIRWRDQFLSDLKNHKACEFIDQWPKVFRPSSICMPKV